MQKSSVDAIRHHFDNSVERFSNLETAQESLIDSPLILDLMVRSASRCNPSANKVLDVGCGAGNYSLKLLQYIPSIDLTLLDLSKPMLERAQQRITPIIQGNIDLLQSDIRDATLKESSFDIVMTGAVLHHLRQEAEWESVFSKIYRCLRPGGSFWVADLIEQSISVLQEIMCERYGDYLSEKKGESFRDMVFQSIEQEDTPRPLYFQLQMLERVGFSQIDVLHKNCLSVAYCAIK